MNGVLTVTDQNLIAVVCRATHNSTNTTTRFYVNGSVLSETTHPLVLSRVARVSSFNDCYVSPPQDRCEELTLVLRVTPQINNTRITCRSRSRDTNSGMGQIQSQDTITVILKDPGMYIATCMYRDMRGFLYMGGSLKSTSTCMYMYMYNHVYCMYLLHHCTSGRNMHVDRGTDIVEYIVHR